MTETNGKHKLDPRFISQIQDNDFVFYEGLLDLAHQHGLTRLEVDFIQYPTKENEMTAICRATAVSKDGAVFTDFGDANPGNVRKGVVSHIIRMASTRAKARVLRDLTNIGITCLDELADMEGGDRAKKEKRTNAYNPAEDWRSKNKTGPASNQPARPATQAAPLPEPMPRPKANAPTNGGDAPPISDAQKRALFNLATKNGLTPDELQKMSHDLFHCALESITCGQAAEMIRQLQAK